MQLADLDLQSNLNNKFGKRFKYKVPENRTKILTILKLCELFIFTQCDG